MKTTLKIILSIIGIVLCSLNVNAYYIADNIKYEILSESDRTVEATGIEKAESEEVQIPPKIVINGYTYTVSSIGRDFKLGGATKLILPNTVTEISAYAFYYTGYKLNEIVLSNSLTHIGYQAFGETKLKEINLPNSLVEIEPCAFLDCCELTSITIPSSVKTIGTRAFGGCKNLSHIIVDENNTNYASYDGALYDKSLTTLIMCPQTKQEISIANTVTTIGDHAFRGCSQIKNISIPESTTSYGRYAFYGCSSLQSIRIPESMTKIGLRTFSGCTSLTTIDIPNSITEIGESAFNGCSSIKVLNLPSSITDIGSYAFQLCEGLEQVHINSDINISEYAFSYEGNTNISSVYLGENVSFVSDNLFKGNDNIRTIYCASTTPPKSTNRFSNSVIKEAILYVPKGSLAEYEKVDPWRNFWNIKEQDFSSLETNLEETSSISVNGHMIIINGYNGELIEVFTPSGSKIFSGYDSQIELNSAGVFIIRIGNSVKKILL